MALFSQLLGLSRADASATTKAEDEREDRDEDKKESKAKAEDEDDKDSEAKAEDGDDDEKESKASEGDKDDEDGKSKAFAAGVEAERSRAAAILKTATSLQHLAVAAELVCSTRLSPAEARAVLKVSGALGASEPPRRASLADRMERQPKASIGPGGNAGPDMSTTAGAAAFVLGAGRAAQKEG